MSTEFPLQQVLEYQRRRAQQKQRDLVTLSQKRQLMEQTVESLRRRALQVRQSLESREGARVDPREMESVRSYIEGVERSIRTHQQSMAELEAQVVTSREELVVLSKEQRMLEQLEQRALDAATLEGRRRESRDLDELNGARYVRDMREAS